MKIYNVYTDLPPEELTAVGFAVMKKWIEFALGKTELNGHRVENSTGLMASAVRVKPRDASHIAIIIDEDIAPEAGYLEEGHRAINMKKYLKPGTYYPMHRGGVFSGYAKTPPAQPKRTGKRSRKWKSMYADSWIIPAMPAWSPVSYLADMIRSGEFKT
jgi:hypothetical protein